MKKRVMKKKSLDLADHRSRLHAAPGPRKTHPLAWVLLLMLLVSALIIVVLQRG